MSTIVESVEGAIKKAETAVVAEAKKIEGVFVKDDKIVVADVEKGCKFVCAECEKMDAAAKAEAAKLVADAKAEAEKVQADAHAAIADVAAKLGAFTKVVKDEAAKSSAIKELETVVDALKHPPAAVTLVVDEAAALAAKATHDVAVAAAKELSAQAQEDAVAASGWIVRAWHRAWSWI